MNNSTFSTFRWLFELTKTFISGAPFSTPLSVLATLISQVALMMSFLMPLKVVMLLGSDRIPSYFPEIFLKFEKNTVIFFLVILSISSFAISAVFKKTSEKAIEIGVERLLERTQKIILFENQHNFASQAYTKYTDALASSVFTIVTTSFLCIFYVDIAIFIIVCFILCLSATSFAYISSPILKKIINDKPQPTALAETNILFMLIFLFIVIDFLYLSPPSFVIGLITIIISRLMLVRLAFTCAHVFTLRRDESKINALFFHNHAFTPPIKSHQKSVWDLLTPEVVENWLSSLLQEALPDTASDIVYIQWLQTRLNHTLVLRVGMQKKDLLIKVYEERFVTQALHESSLMIETSENQLPCPQFLVATKIGNYHCHVFDITGYKSLTPKEASKLNHLVNHQLLITSPPRELLERYQRSKSFIWERIGEEMINRLKLVANKQEQETIKAFESAMPKAKSILKELPLSFVNNKLNNTAFLRSPEGQVVSFHWSFWIIEPTGYGINSHKDNSPDMNAIIHTAKERREELVEFPVESFELADLLSSVEYSFIQQQYTDAIDFLRQSLEKLDSLNLAGHTQT